ncbi:hypothetical protein ACWD5Q_06635 [Streptomyces sp. NPDC002513]
MNQPRHTPAEAVQYWYDAAVERREERDRLRAVVARIRQMTDAWEQQLPEVIRTPAVVSALRAALEPAAASAVVSPPTGRTALRDRIRRAVCEAEGFAWDSDMLEPDEYGEVADAVLAVLPEPTSRAAEEAAVVPPPALTEVGRLRAQVEVLTQDMARNQGLAKVGARCMREGHQGLIETGRVVLEGHRFALSVKLDLGTGAPWDAIYERVQELRRLAAEAQQQRGTEAPTSFVLWLDASDGSVPTHDGVQWPDGTTTIHHRHFGYTTTHHDPEAARRAAHGEQGRIVWPHTATEPAPVAQQPAAAEEGEAS